MESKALTMPQIEQFGMIMQWELGSEDDKKGIIESTWMEFLANNSKIPKPDLEKGRAGFK